MQPLFTATGIRAWDEHTMRSQNLSSIALMERAARAFCKAFQEDFPKTERQVTILCGPGNNGGDGYAIARLLRDQHYPVHIIEFEQFSKRSEDAEAMRNLALEKREISFLDWRDVNEQVLSHSILIDAILGSGLNRTLEPWLTDIIQSLNQINADKIAVDIPTGAFTDNFHGEAVFNVDCCYSFESYKYSQLFPESARYCKMTKLIPIGLSQDFTSSEHTLGHTIEAKDAVSSFTSRDKFSHKGSFGHALFVGGSKAKMGAALLSSRACMQTGVGVLTAHIPNVGNQTFNLGLPEAMLLDEDEDWISRVHSLPKITALGCGPGMGTRGATADALLNYLETNTISTVLDADALNIIAERGLRHLPPNVIITPHPGEFKRLFGTSKDSIAQHSLQINMSQTHSIYIILKGAHSCLTTPEGQSYFLINGNPGMATAGSGDVLTGIILSLLAQGNSAKEAAISGMYLHACAGDLAQKKLGSYSVTASSIIAHIPEAILKIQTT